jgi:hypothetical protein
VVHHTRPTDLRYYVAFALDRLVDSLLMGPSGALAMPQGNLLLPGLYICDNFPRTEPGHTIMRDGYVRLRKVVPSVVRTILPLLSTSILLFPNAGEV